MIRKKLICSGGIIVNLNWSRIDGNKLFGLEIHGIYN